MSHISLQTQTSLERLIPPLNNQSQSARQNSQNRNSIASPSTHTPSASTARHGMTYSTSRGGQYALFLPSGPRTTSNATNPSYGPSPSSHHPHWTSPSQVTSSNINTNNTRRYTPLVQPYVPDHNNSHPQFHARTNHNFSLNQTSNSNNPSANTNVNTSLNPLMYRCPSNTITSPSAGAATNLATLRPLPYPHATSSTYQSVSPHSVPMLPVSSNVRPCLRQTVDNQGSEFTIRSRSRAFHSNAHPDVPNSSPNQVLSSIRSSLPSERCNSINNPESSSNPSESTPPSVPRTRRRPLRTRLPAASPPGDDSATSISNKLPDKKKDPMKGKKQEKKKKIEEEKDKSEKDQCSICLEIPSKTEEATINGCSHKFCFQCIEKWADRENTCPLCKLRFTKIDRVSKTPAKKRKKGDLPRPKNTKKVKNRDQRADIVIGSHLQGLFASVDGDVPQAITQLIFAPINHRFVTIATGNASSSGNNNTSHRITLQNRLRSPMQTSRFSNNRPRIINTGSSTLAPLLGIAGDLPPLPIRRSRFTENRTSNNNSGNSLSQSFMEQMNQSFVFDSDFPSFQANSSFNNPGPASEDDDSDQEYRALVSHLNRASEQFQFGFGRSNDNVNEAGNSNQQSIEIDNPFFLENQGQLYQNSNDTNTQSFQPARSYALNIDGGDSAENALEIQDSDDEVEIADMNDEEVEILFD